MNHRHDHDFPFLYIFFISRLGSRFSTLHEKHIIVRTSRGFTEKFLDQSGRFYVWRIQSGKESGYLYASEEWKECAY